MYRFFRIFFTTILLTLLAVPMTAFGEEDDSAADSYYSQLDDILADHDIGSDTGELSGADFKEIKDMVIDRIGFEVDDVTKMLGTLIFVIVITAVLKSGGSGIFENSADIFGTVSVLTAVTVIAPPLFDVLGNTVTAVETGGSFIAVFIPVFAGITAAMGGRDLCGHIRYCSPRCCGALCPVFSGDTHAGSHFLGHACCYGERFRRGKPGQHSSSDKEADNLGRYSRHDAFYRISYNEVYSCR
jgi:hypothetical protein